MSARRFAVKSICPVLVLAVLISVLPTRSGRAEEPFDYFRNSWNVVGLRDYEDGARLTPDNRMLLADGGQVRLQFGRNLTSLDRRQTKTALEGWLPVILLAAEDGPVRYNFTFWATPLPTVKDWKKAFDWPTEGENFLNWIKVEVVNTGSQQAEAKLAIQQIGPAVDDDHDFAWSLAPGAREECVVRLPFAPVKDASVFDEEDAQLWLDRTVDYWRDLITTAARIEVPCQKATQALLATHVCQMIANDHGELQGGEGFYDHFYIRDGGYQIMELEEAGLWEAAARAIKFYLKSQREDGRFETQSNQYDANGQAVWTLWQYYKITGDQAWLAKAYPQMRKAVDWAIKARRQTPKDSPFAGMLPNAPADGEYLWDGKHHIVGYDIWNLRGMLCTADAAKAIGKEDEARELIEEATLYRKDLDAAWKRTGLAHFPPSWETKGTHWGNTETLWPTELFQPDDSRVSALIDHARNTHGGGFVEGTILWLGRPDAIHPYMGAYTTMASLVRGEHEQVVEDFYWYLMHSTAANAFPEGIFFKRRFAWSDTIPHVTGASNYAVLLRHMLVHERADELDLLAAVPDWWLAEGREISVLRAPTHFGTINLTVRGTADGVKVDLDPPKRCPPTRIVLHLPKSRPLLGSLAGVEVAERADQKQRWDFDRVIEIYEKDAVEVFRPIPGLVGVPVSPELESSACRPLDLRPLAVTDPFTAPFGVPSPGKLLFTDMPVGRVTAAGVPFDIIDPAKNEGRGFVVLHSPKAPTGIVFPHEVEIPVNQQGRRLFFLGNVHGWGGQDQGAGPWGAVAEYVIRYTDGEEQVVPIISGRTAEDWTSKPKAQEVFAGLQGDPWHLNVLGVSLRPIPVQKIVFRDLGTVAAPVLVGVTLEK